MQSFPTFAMNRIASAADLSCPHDMDRTQDKLLAYYHKSEANFDADEFAHLETLVAEFDALIAAHRP